jgi:hypothetical protein
VCVERSKRLLPPFAGSPLNAGPDTEKQPTPQHRRSSYPWSQKPKKQPRSKKISLNTAKRWKDIVNDVDKKEVPIGILQLIEVKLVDGTNISIDITKLIDDGMHPDDIEELLDNKFNELDAYIENVDFLIDIDKVKDTVQPETDKVLRGL